MAIDECRTLWEREVRERAIGRAGGSPEPASRWGIPLIFLAVIFALWLGFRLVPDTQGLLGDIPFFSRVPPQLCRLAPYPKSRLPLQMYPLHPAAKVRRLHLRRARLCRTLPTFRGAGGCLARATSANCEYCAGFQ